MAVRTRLVYAHAHAYGPFGYTKPENLPKLNGDRFGRFLTRVYEETQRNQEIFVKHFLQKYGDQHSYLPLWMTAEIMPFGVTFTLYNGVEPGIKRKLAREFGIADAVLTSWLGTLNAVRNICAHHGRLWNRELGYRPAIPKRRKNPQWHSPIAIPDNRVFAVLTVLKYMLDIVAPQSQWLERLHSLLQEYPEIPQYAMGFPKEWTKSPIWRK